jgi:hypothetical protein
MTEREVPRRLGRRGDYFRVRRVPDPSILVANEVISTGLRVNQGLVTCILVLRHRGSWISFLDDEAHSVEHVVNLVG